MPNCIACFSRTGHTVQCQHVLHVCLSEQAGCVHVLMFNVMACLQAGPLLIHRCRQCQGPADQWNARLHLLGAQRSVSAVCTVVQACANVMTHTCLSTNGQSGSGMWDASNAIRAILTGKVGSGCSVWA